jgi:hypothetical protein
VTTDVNLLASSMIGDGLNPSPYKEALARAERAEAERDAYRATLEGMAFESLDLLTSKGTEAARQVGKVAAERIIAVIAERDALRGLLADIRRRGVVDDLTMKMIDAALAKGEG